MADLLQLQPVPKLLERVRGELAANFSDDKQLLVSRAPGRLDVMGGIADYTGSLVCEMPLDRAAAVASTQRADRALNVVSLNLIDHHRPFQFSIPLDKLASVSVSDFRKDLQADHSATPGPNRLWAGYLVGCVLILRDEGLLDVNAMPGLDLALLSDVPLGSGVSSSAAIEVATMMNLLGRFDLLEKVDPMKVAAMCQRVENNAVGAPCGVMDQATSVCGVAGQLMRMVCQPHELETPLDLPRGVKVIGIVSGVRHSVGGGEYGLTRTSAFIAHALMLERMKDLATASGRTLTGDPTHGYLANIDADDYKAFFRPALPEYLRGDEFTGVMQDTATVIEPTQTYHVRAAADHHVLEARRVRRFSKFMEAVSYDRSTLEKPPAARDLRLDRCGHIMYASHKSYRDNALLGDPACDLMVAMIRAAEPSGLYGGKITGGGKGGTVALLMDDTPEADDAVKGILRDYQDQTGNTPTLLAGTSDGAWGVGVGRC